MKKISIFILIVVLLCNIVLIGCRAIDKPVETTTTMEEFTEESKDPIIEESTVAEDVKEDATITLNKLEEIVKVTEVETYIAPEVVETEDVVEIVPEGEAASAPESTENIENTTEDSTTDTAEDTTEDTTEEPPIETPPSDTYDSATYVWAYLTETLGYNKYVAAGILGNMMVECGNQDLNLHWDVYSPDGYYGICQWSGYYYPSVHGTDLATQCNFLGSTIESEFNSFGSIYGYSYEDFLAIQNEQEAALVFAEVYERCASFSYGSRQSCASVALGYFG